MEDLGWKIASAGAAAVAAMGASKIAEIGWRLATGNEAPREDDDEATLASLVIFAAASAAVVAIAQRYALRSAKKFWGPSPSGPKSLEA